MNFDFSDDQKMIADQVRRQLADVSPLQEVRRVFEDASGYSKPAWRALAQLGVLGAAIPEEHGGVGLGALELCVAAYEIGYALAPVPFTGTCGVCAMALLEYGRGPQADTWLSRIASGEAIGAFAFRPANISVDRSGDSLSGMIDLVNYGHQADILLAEAKEPDGTGLYLIDLSQPGVERTVLDTLDPTRPAAAITFDNTPAIRLTAGAQTMSASAQLMDGAAVLLAFEQIGAAQRALEMACDYARQRKAFGNPIGAYQGIKHKLAEVYVGIETARVHAYWGAWAMAAKANEWPLAAASARVSATEALTLAAQENIQTHGGIGFTWESDCQLFYRRARADASCLGPAHVWREKIVRAIEIKNAA